MCLDTGITFRRADMKDLDDIMVLIRASIVRMCEQNIDQWDDIYPCADDFKNDILRKEAYIGLCDERIAAVYTINTLFDDAYRSEGIRWNEPLAGSACIHRVCVHPQMQGCGIGKRTLQNAEDRLVALGYKSVKLDVFTENRVALEMYAHAGYEPKGSAVWRKGKFVLMEKHIGHDKYD